MTRLSKIALKAGAAMTVALGAQAHAQQTKADGDSAQATEEGVAIVVTGTRLQLRNAIDEKREEDRVADVVTEDDVGNLPDFNAAEALSRIPGVTVTADQAEGRFVTIRGLDPNFNNTTVDGQTVSSTDINGRQIEMDVVPASLASSIQVIKTLTPDMDASAIGGTINFVSRSPYDYQDDFFAITGAYGLYQHRDGYRGEKPSGNADLVYSAIFGNNDQFGIVASANYYRRASYLGRIEQGDENLWHPGPGVEYSSRSDRVDSYASDYYIPEEWKALNYHNDRQRYGGSLKFEWRPSDAAQTWLRGYYNRADDSEARMETKMWNRERNARITYDSPTTGTIENTEWSTQLGRFEFARETWGIKLAGRYHLDDDWHFEPTVNVSGSSYQQPQIFDRFIQKTADFAFDTSSEITRWQATSEDAFDASLFDFNKRELNTDRLEEVIFEAGFNLGYNDRDDDRGFGFRAGYRYQDKDKNYDYERTEFRFGDGLTLADVSWSRGCPTTMPSCANDLFITMDIGSIDALVASFLNSDDTDLRENEDDDALRDYDASETVNAAYLMAIFQTDTLDVRGGLRYEDTRFDSTGLRDDRDLREYVPTNNSNDYDNVLGSFNLRYDATDNLVLRAAFGQSLSRPRLSRQAARGERIDFDGTEVSITRGNPDLLPQEADNYDLGLEWYLPDGSGLFSVGAFYKDIRNQTFRTTQDLEILFDQDGDGTEELTPASIRQWVNGPPAKIYGVEVGLTKELDAIIPGLGFNLNATILDSDWTIELEDGNVREPETFFLQSDFTANGVIYYQTGGFEARVAVNHTGLKLNNLYTSRIADAYRDQYDRSRTQVDAQVRYDIDDRFSVYVNAWNLFNEKQYELLGRNQEFVRWESDFGRAFFFGVSFKN